MFEKFKSLLEDDVIYGAILLVLVGGLSFGLGRLSVPSLSQPVVSRVQLVASSSPENQKNASATTQNAATVLLAEPANIPVSGPFVASKSGTRYYLVSCAGVKRIKDENKVYFKTAKDAAAAGYQPATHCPGL